VALCVTWQTTTVALIGIAIGVPLGIAAGRAIWSAFADFLGVATPPVITVWLIVALAAATLFVANLLAVIPALVAARSRPASLLRTE
jgi:ABC-type antimicrobial peptide transport system permease subunit